MMIGSRNVLEKYGDYLRLAEALILGKLDCNEQEYACAILGKTIMEAARIRLEQKLPQWKELVTLLYEITDGEPSSNPERLKQLRAELL